MVGAIDWSSGTQLVIVKELHWKVRTLHPAVCELQELINYPDE